MDTVKQTPHIHTVDSFIYVKVTLLQVVARQNSGFPVLGQFLTKQQVLDWPKLATFRRLEWQQIIQI